MKSNVFSNSTYRYLNYVDKPTPNVFPLPNSIGKLPKIKMKLPEISMALANVEILI